MDAMEIVYNFGIYTPFGYFVPRKKEPLTDSDLISSEIQNLLNNNNNEQKKRI